MIQQHRKDPPPTQNDFLTNRTENDIPIVPQAKEIITPSVQNQMTSSQQSEFSEETCTSRIACIRRLGEKSQMMRNMIITSKVTRDICVMSWFKLSEMAT